MSALRQLDHQQVNRPTASETPNRRRSGPAPQVEVRWLGSFEKVCLSLVFCLSFLALFAVLWMKGQTYQTQERISQLEDQAEELDGQTNDLFYQLMEFGDYQEIQEAAQAAGLSVDKSRIKVIDYEE